MKEKHLFLIALSFVIIFVCAFVPLIEPQVKILCISEPCFVPKQTIFEYVSEHFGSI